MRDFLISTARALWKFIIRYSDLVWALGVSILGVFLQRAFYFKDNPFFGLEYFGEVLISSGIFLLVYFFGKTVVGGVELGAGGVERSIFYGYIYPHGFEPI